MNNSEIYDHEGAAAPSFYVLLVSGVLFTRQFLDNIMR